MQLLSDTVKNQLTAEGYSVVDDLFTAAQCAQMAQHIADWQTANHLPTHAARAILTHCPNLRERVLTPTVWQWVQSFLGSEVRLIKSLYFDKPPGQVWKVPTHQDVTLALSQKAALSGYGPWTRKAGVWHAQPPAAVLEGILTLRIHLDEQTAANGALRVWPGTHKKGKLADGEIAAVVRAHSPVIIEAPLGSALLMRPLLVHASHSHSVGQHRRVLHLEFWNGYLPPTIPFFET